MNASPRAWAAELTARRPVLHTVECGGCGHESRSELSLETHAAMLFNVGWEKGADGKLRCPKCIASTYVARVHGSKGAEYVVRTLGGITTCTCPSFAYCRSEHRRCKHTDAAPKAIPAPSADDVELRVRDEDTGEELTCSLACFVDANAEDLGACSDVRALAVGESIQLGGGAAPVVTVRRLS